MAASTGSGCVTGAMCPTPGSSTNVSLGYRTYLSTKAPAMSGKELADALSRDRPALRVLYLSGYTQDTIVHQGVLDSAVDFLAKPYTPSALLARVREVLDAG